MKFNEIKAVAFRLGTKCFRFLTIFVGTFFFSAERSLPINVTHKCCTHECYLPSMLKQTSGEGVTQKTWKHQSVVLDGLSPSQVSV